MIKKLVEDFRKFYISFVAFQIFLQLFVIDIVSPRDSKCSQSPLRRIFVHSDKEVADVIARPVDAVFTLTSFKFFKKKSIP